MVALTVTIPQTRQKKVVEKAEQAPRAALDATQDILRTLGAPTDVEQGRRRGKRI